MTDLQFYTNPMSRGRIVRWMLEELGEPYEAHIVGWGPALQGDYRGINPMGKVPAIRHGETVVTEAAAICTYLAQAFPQASLVPEPGTKAHGEFLRWMFFAAGPVEAAVTNKALGVEVPADKQMMVGYGSLERVVDTLTGWLDGREWFVGETFSAADVYAGSQVAWGLQFGTLPSNRVLETYAERIANRPAAVRAREIDDALLEQDGAQS